MKNLPLALVLLALSALTTQAAHAGKFTHLSGNPDLRSASALVLDASGEVIYGKDT